MKGANGTQSKRVKEKMLSNLEQLQQSGVEFFVDGEATPVGEVFRCTVREPFAYMADYVLDENGSVQQVRFDRVDLQ